MTGLINACCLSDEWWHSIHNDLTHALHRMATVTASDIIGRVHVLIDRWTHGRLANTMFCSVMFCLRNLITICLYVNAMSQHNGTMSTFLQRCKYADIGGEGCEVMVYVYFAGHFSHAPQKFKTTRYKINSFTLYFGHLSAEACPFLMLSPRFILYCCIHALGYPLRCRINWQRLRWWPR